MTHPYEYQPIDFEVVLNTDDPSLFPIHINQLDLIQRTYRQYGQVEPEDFPEWELVDGYGKPPEEQKFEREVIPQGLVELERAIRKELKPRGKARDLSPVRRELAVITRFWEELENNQEKYRVEIEFIERCWYHRLIGKFFFCNGKVTYITGQNWFYLNFWHLGNIYPEYRDRDRRWFVGLKYCEVCTTTFKDIDEETGLPVKNEFGDYEMVDIGRRTIFMPNFLKARRVGDSSKIENALCEFATRKLGGKQGIQGKDDENASTIFSEFFVQPFLKLCIFWKPVFDTAGGIAPKNSMLFDDLDDIDFGLHSIIEFATSSDKAKFDGKYLDFYHLDEGGKMQRSDVNDVFDVVKFCLSLGAGGEIHGIGASVTTVDEIEDQSAGENFMRLCARSHFERRDANGQTSSGMVNIFFRAEDGLQGYVGPYGESIIETPTPEQTRYTGKTIGARKFIDNKISEHRRSKNFDALAMFRRQHPQTFLDCFTPPVKNQILRRDLIEAQIQYLQVHPELQAVRGDFYWISGVDSTVGWLPNPESGRFYLSRTFKQGEHNQKVRRDGMWCPADPTKFLGSPDTIGTDSPKGRASKGGLVIHWLRDRINDPDEKQPELVESDRDILTYGFRPDSVEAYCEDMLMAHVYIGAMCYPEKNRRNVTEHFRRRGYGGYLLSNYNRTTGKPEEEPGWWNGAGNLVDDAIRWLIDDINKNITRCYHLDILKEYLEFGGRSYITNLDIIAAKLGTLIGSKNPFYNIVTSYNNQIDCSDFIPWYRD